MDGHSARSIGCSSAAGLIVLLGVGSTALAAAGSGATRVLEQHTRQRRWIKMDPSGPTERGVHGQRNLEQSSVGASARSDAAHTRAHDDMQLATTAARPRAVARSWSSCMDAAQQLGWIVASSRVRQASSAAFILRRTRGRERSRASLGARRHAAQAEKEQLAQRSRSWRKDTRRDLTSGRAQVQSPGEDGVGAGRTAGCAASEDQSESERGGCDRRHTYEPRGARMYGAVASCDYSSPLLWTESSPWSSMTTASMRALWLAQQASSSLPWLSVLTVQ